MDKAIEDALARVDKQWRAMGVVAADRAALADDLRADLTAAAADGPTPERLIGDDVRAFARDLATGAGVRLVPYEFRRLLLSALAGGLITPVTMGFALLTGYSDALLVVAVETAIIAGALAGAIVLARWWALAPTLRQRHVAASGRPVGRSRREMTGPAT